MEKKKRIGFFKRIKMSIFGLENYIEFTAEKTGKAILFMFILAFLFVIIIVASNIVYLYATYGSPVNYLNDTLPDFKIENSTVVIENEDSQNEEQKIIADTIKQMESTYSGIFDNQNISKQDIINYANENERSVIISMSSFIFISEYADLLLLWLTTATLTSLIGLIVLRFSRIKMKYSKLFALSIYASTLSMVLTVIYSIANSFFNVYIDIFEYLSMLISYIYITAVIYMIKSDLIRQQVELIRIAAIQKNKSEEKEEEQEENQEKDEKDDKDKEEKNGEENTKEKDEKDDLDEPDGSEI